MASVQIFTAEIRVQFQGRRCVMLVKVVRPKMDAVEPCKTVFKSVPNYTVSPLRRGQLFLLWGPQILQSAALVFSLSVYVTWVLHRVQQTQFWPHYCCLVLCLFVNYSCLLVHMWLVGWLGYFNKINEMQEMAADSCQIKEWCYALLLNSKLLFSFCIQVNYEHKSASDLGFSR